MVTKDKSEYLKKYYAKNKEKILARQKKYYQENREKILKQQSEYFENKYHNDWEFREKRLTVNQRLKATDPEKYFQKMERQKLKYQEKKTKIKKINIYEILSK